MKETGTLRGRIIKAAMIITPVVIGIILFQVMSGNRKPPGQKNVVQDILTVRTLTVQPMDVTPSAIGHGISQPVRQWKAIAQVSGRIVFTHSNFEKGSLVKEGTVLLKIDPTEYEISIAKLEAAIQNYRIQIDQLEIEKKNNLRLLNLQQSNLELKRKDVERQKTLL